MQKEKSLSEEQSSLVNEAYHTLLKPLKRGLYLVSHLIYQCSIIWINLITWYSYLFIMKSSRYCQSDLFLQYYYLMLQQHAPNFTPIIQRGGGVNSLQFTPSPLHFRSGPCLSVSCAKVMLCECIKTQQLFLFLVSSILLALSPSRLPHFFVFPAPPPPYYSQIFSSIQCRLKLKCQMCNSAKQMYECKSSVGLKMVLETIIVSKTAKCTLITNQCFY